MDRNVKLSQRTILPRHERKSSHMVGTKDEDDSIRPVSGVDVRCAGGGRDERNSATSFKDEKRGSPLQNNRARNGHNNSFDSRGRLRNAFAETRGDNVSIRTSGKRPLNPGRSATSSETSRSRIVVPIQREPLDNSSCTRDPKSDTTITNMMGYKDFESYLDDYPLKKRHTIVRPRRSSRLAGPDDLNLPLHIKPDIPRIDLFKIYSGGCRRSPIR